MAKRALILAVDTYADEGLRALQAPTQDADGLADVLQDPGIAGFEVTVKKNLSLDAAGEVIGDFFTQLPATTWPYCTSVVTASRM